MYFLEICPVFLGNGDEIGQSGSLWNLELDSEARMRQVLEDAKEGLVLVVDQAAKG